MYQTLYRAWRPQSFSDMVGQNAVVNTLKNQIITRHIAHAYLFCGTRGTGKTSAARILSMAINCENPQNGDPCLECESCLTLQRDASLDVFEMDAASNSRVEEIREMLEKVNYPPQQANYKVYIIDEVHMLSNAAFNALLKTLEEPPSYMVFILATTEPQKLPATILSRCQRFDFGRISKEDIVSRLKMALKDIEAEESAIWLIASAAEGSMRDAWSLLDMCLQPGQALTEQHVRTALGTVSREFLYDFFDAIIKRDMREVLNLTDKLMASGKDIQVFLRSFSQHLRDILQAYFDKQSTNDERIIEQAQQVSPHRLTLLLEQSMKTESDVKWSSSPRTNLEAFALRACLESTDESDILAMAEKIIALEKKIEDLASGKIALTPTNKHTQSIESSLEKSEKQEIHAPKKQEDSVNQEDEFKSENTFEENIEKTASHTINTLETIENPSVNANKPEHIPQNTDSGITPKAAWNNMLKRAQKELTSSYGIIQQGKYGGFLDGRFTLFYETGKEPYLAFVNDPSRKSLIEKLLQEEFGSPVSFEARIDKGDINKVGTEKQSEKDIEQLSSFVGRENIVLKK
ncbi:MAG: DNA polymerase III subunit gamma/tau [Eubacteriales bacterium]|nr:DNA polymerase III subunit gamma/tau [Eubacteriales bacterium]